MRSISKSRTSFSGPTPWILPHSLLVFGVISAATFFVPATLAQNSAPPATESPQPPAESPTSPDKADGSDSPEKVPPQTNAPDAAATSNEPNLRGDKHFPDGMIQTGAGYHSISGRISRTVVDITVPGSVGKYPLTITRTMRNWVTNPTSNPNVPSWDEAAACSSYWAFNLYGYVVRVVDWGYSNDQGVFLRYPDGSEDRVTATATSGVFTASSGDRVYVAANLKITMVRLSDGGTVYFNDRNDPTQRTWTTARVVDPYGLTTTYTSGGSEVKVTDASGRWVRLVFGSKEPIRAEASTGEYVDYVWDLTTPAGVIRSINPDKLMEARYADGTVARYEYTSNTRGVFPFRCYDTRATSHMRSVEYKFDLTKGSWGNVQNRTWLALYPLIDERVPGASGALSSRAEFAAGYAYGLGVRETRGDGAKREIVPGSAWNSSTYGSRVFSETDFTAHKSEYTYGQTGTITDPLGRKTTVDYAYLGPAPTDVIETPTKITYPDGSFRRFVYTDAQNPYYVRQTIDELGRTTTYDRHANKVISQITHPDGSTEAWGSLNAFNQPGTYRRRNGATESMTYDSRGLLLKHSNPYSSGNATSFITYTYYPLGHVWADRVKTITDQRGNVTTYEYDLKFVNGAQSTTPCPGRGLVTKIINPDSSTRTFVYDIQGNKLAETNELGRTTRYTYDDYNRVTQITDPLGGATLYQYGDTAAQALAHTANAPRRITSPAGRKTAWTYDADKRPTLQVLAEGTSDAQYLRYEYDAVGNLKKLREQVGGTAGSGSETYRDTSYDYDNRDRRITELAPLGRTTEWGYDAVGNNLWIQYPDDSKTQKAYDSMNRVIRETDEMGRITTYAYFPSGKVKSVTDPRSKTYNYTYDPSDRVLQFQLPNAAGTGYDYEQNTYDAAGNVTQFRNRSGALKTMTYDNRNREKTTNWNDGTPGTSTTYDVGSRVTQKSNSVSTLTYTYDALDRMLTETQAIAGFAAKTVTYTHDADGNRLSLYFTGGYGIRYEHNGRSRLAKVNWWNSTNAATYTYRPDGLRKKRTLDNGSATDYDYDAAGRPTLVYNYATANGATIEKQQYGYDLRDRRTWTRRNDDLGDTYAYQLDGQLTDFRFNANNPQATPSTWVSRNTFTYDAAGNRTAVVNNGTTISYTPNSANQYSAITGVTIQHGDGRGNTTKLRDWTYAYDADNRMKTASRTGTSATFAYDPVGRLVKRTIAGVVEYLIYDGPQIVQRYDTSDTLQGWVVWGANPDEPLIDYTPAAGKHYYHSDVQGNTITVTDASLNTLERYRYDAYGNVTFWAWSGAQRPQSTAGTKYLFTGQEYVAALGLHNYKNRMYVSEIGRFLQSDPKRLDGGDLNLYRYCRNSPFNRTDPLGLEETEGANGVTDEDIFADRDNADITWRERLARISADDSRNPIVRAAAFVAFIPVNLRARFYDAAHEASDGDAMYANAQADIMLGVAAEVGVAAAPALTRIFSRSTTQSTGVMLREGDAVLAIVKDGRILAQSGDMLMSHQLFVARTIGSVPKGAEVVTIGKFEGQIMAITSKTIHGNQLPASTAAQAAAQAAFK